MKASIFYKQLSILTFVMMIFVVGLSQIALFKGTLLFSFLSLFLFVAFTILIFYLGSRAVLSSDKNQFTVVAFLAIFGKLILTLVILFSYNHLVQPDSKMYVILFLIIYLAFTVFETGIMMRLSKSSDDEISI